MTFVTSSFLSWNLRKAAAACAILAAVSGSAMAAEVKMIPAKAPAEELPAAEDLVAWPDKPYHEFAAGSVVNVGEWLFDAPAGKHGHVQTRGGDLVFEDGTPVKFWGTTTVYGASFPDTPADAAKLAEAIASAGYNMVRFHHADTGYGKMSFLKAGSNSQLDPEGMDRLDRFAAELYKRGVYTYLGLVDSKPNLAEDGLDDWQALAKINGGWKGLFPHPRIVDAWKRGASEFLNHKNPYTGRTWGEEPGLATIEIINENGPFWDWNFKLTDPMLKWHEGQWNAWLLAKYGGRERLDSAWTDAGGKKGLYEGEDPTKGTVFAPKLGSYLEWERPYRSKTRGAARLNDFYEYLGETATTFYTEASKHLRDLGYRGAVIGSHELQGAMDQYSQVKGTGTIAAHLYAPGNTAWQGRPTSRGAAIEGVDVKTNNWFSNLPRIKVEGVPGINGEWTGGTLTRRADANVAVAAMTAFQGVDESLHFSYAHRWGGMPMRNFDTFIDYRAHLKEFGVTFTSMHDAPWMAVNRICAPLFARGDFQKPKTTVHIAYSAEDLHEQNLHALGISGGGGTIGDAALFLPMLHNVESFYFDTQYDGQADVVFMTGRSASGDYSKAKHAVLVGDNPWQDRYHKGRDIGAPARAIRPEAKVVTLETPVTFTVGEPWGQTKTLHFSRLEGAVESASVPAGALQIGKSEDGKYTLGWIDDRFVVLPNGRAFGSQIKDVQWLYRLYLAAAKRWGIDTAGNTPDSGMYRSDTGELTIDWSFGTTVIDTPKTQGFSGFAGWREKNATSNLECKLELPYGNVLVTAADNQPIAQSRRMLLVATGRMKNTEQELGKDANGFQNVVKTGKGPKLVESLRGEVQLRSELADQLVVWALDNTGRRLGEVPVKAQGGLLSFELSPRWGTIWFEISTSEFIAPKVAGAAWPLEVKPRASESPKPTLIAMEELFQKATAGAAAPSEAPAETAQSLRVAVKDFAQDKTVYHYSNVKPSIVSDPEHGQVMSVQFGKITDSWAGGVWWPVAPVGGLGAEDINSIVITFKGDGTLPRETYLDVRNSEGVSWRTGNINRIFESDGWQSFVISPADFTLSADYAKKNPDKAQSLKSPAWGDIVRMDFSCVGPLMSQASVGTMAKIEFVLNRAPATEKREAAAFRAMLPELKSPAAPSVVLPFIADAEIKAGGTPDEAAWSKAIAIPMNEDDVPAWHFFGSHIVDGKRLNDEGANFWMLGTSRGLALLAEVVKGSDEVVAEHADWYMCDCVELFSDVSNAGGKPTKQLFLAYRRPAVDRPAASEPGIQIGRTKLTGGYALEALIPWQAMGFSGVPQGEFGLEFQVDFARKGGKRALQMTYGTGTNEAWIKADRFLKVTVQKD